MYTRLTRSRLLSALSHINHEKDQTIKFLATLSTCTVFCVTVIWLRDVNCPLYDLTLPLLIKFVDPEKCHKLSIYMAKRKLFPIDTWPNPPSLGTSIGPLRLSNPLGIAAGFDKDAEAPLEILKLGYGFIEVGTVVLNPQPGNIKPRLWRIPSHLSLVNSYGFNSKGIDVMVKNLKSARARQSNDNLVKSSLIGVSIGRNKESTTFVKDLSICVSKVAAYADYIAINVSSPNTKNLRDSQSNQALRELITTAQRILNELNPDSFCNTYRRKPLLCVKISPDLTDDQIQDIAKVALECKLDALIVCNTTVSRPRILVEEKLPGEYTANELPGGLSGLLLRDISTKLVHKVYKYTGGRVPIIASGGIFSGHDVLTKIEAGASACQIFTGMIYQGPKTANKIKKDLCQILSARGYTSISDAVGRAHREG